MREIILKKRYPYSREEDITDAFMRGYEKGKADRPQGKWIIEIDANGNTYGRCPICGMRQYAGQINFCPECGADMRKGADDDTI